LIIKIYSNLSAEIQTLFNHSIAYCITTEGKREYNALNPAGEAGENI